MTTQHVVADDVLGKVSKKMWELTRRIMEGTVNSLRSMFYIQTALEGVPFPTSMSYMYLIESVWSFDQTNHEYATLTLETLGQANPMAFEAMLSPNVPRAEKELLLKMLDRIYEAQVPTHGSRGRRRVYRVLGRRNFVGFPNNKDIVVEQTFTLKPLFDIEETGNPVPHDLK